MITQKHLTQWLSLPGLAYLLQAVCGAIRKIREHTGNGPASQEQRQLAQLVRDLASGIRNKYDTENDFDIKATSLLALLDAYEITGEEPHLQFAIPRSEKLLQNLKNTPLKCILLCYCYHYTEDPECAEEARHILGSSDATPEMAEARKYYQDLIAN